MADETTDDDLHEFDPTSDVPEYLYDRLADYLAELITRGRFRRYQKFPGEIQLSSEYGVSLGTARHATELLRRRGLVTTVKSKGTYVTYDIGTASIERPVHHDYRGTS
ncbi:winged helix-turn-helix domain-containing protein [Amycolatopsis sp. GM8]|uniref:winged helix-turn-helix domain-containing protein n=1 Tax=Amycolatopsis sp. GM8 TaxID=2896530 RepID=UPI001F280C7E|nr:winged helix-turn-helix domain-containing protein [Amycolatopsis sp. GM8]